MKTFVVWAVYGPLMFQDKEWVHQLIRSFPYNEKQEALEYRDQLRVLNGRDEFFVIKEKEQRVDEEATEVAS